MGTRRIWTTPSYNRFAVTLDGICLAQPDMRRRTVLLAMSPLSPQCRQRPTGAAFLPHSADSGEGRDQALVAAQNEGVAEGAYLACLWALYSLQAARAIIAR
jgi:hypothetical protein